MIAALVIGLASALALLAAILWSIAVPARRLWPARQSTVFGMIVVWALTVAAFACALVLGILDWNGFGWPARARWGLGLPLIVVGNAIAWAGVFEIGLKATSGQAARLKTGGLYRYSRNPQYVADMAILIGWAVLSASPWVLPVVGAGLAAFALSPLAEETWLAEVYGEPYISYRAKVRRYL